MLRNRNLEFGFFCSEYKQYPFPFTINLDNLFGIEQPYELKKLSLMYATQCVPLVACKITIPLSVVEGPSLKYIPTSLKDKKERICWIFIFDVLLFFKLYL